MDKILNTNQAANIARQLHEEGKTIVLAGGCFDILHEGHLAFLKAAKHQGDVLFILLESDENVKRRKGKGRPINSAKNRAIVLSEVKSVDYVVLLSGVTKDEEYDRIMVKIKPDIVAATHGDPQILRRTKQCKMVGAKLKLVIKKIENKSTTALVKKIRN